MLFYLLHKVLHTRFLPPNLILNSAALSKQSVRDAIFPELDKPNPILKITQISGLTIIFSDYHLIYYLSIPLLDTQNYDLYKASAIPIRQSYFNTSNTFAISNDNRTYVPMTFEKINKCKKLDKTLVCKETEPVRDVRENAPCEVKFTIHQNQT